MESPIAKFLHMHFRLRLVVKVVIIVLIPVLLLANNTNPSWWTDRGVINSHTENDYAAINQGQLKNMAMNAAAELNANLTGGAGDELNQLVVTLSTTTALTNDYTAVSIGQLKTIAKPLFDRLLQAGYQGRPLESGTYPWIGREASVNDYAMVNIGQAKNLFSFDITFKTDTTNPLPDWWQLHYFGDTGVAPTADPDGDGVTNLQEYQLGTNPTKALDNNNNGIPDDWEIIHANSLSAWPSPITMQLLRNQSGTNTLILNNSTEQAVQYSVALTNNLAAGFIYSYLDSKTGGVTFTWEDISQTGTQLTGGAASDDNYESIDLGRFTFPYYGQSYSRVYVGSNGLITLGQGSGSLNFVNLPSQDAPFNLIAPLWCDLYPPNGAVYYKEFPDHLVIQYQNVPSYRNRGNQDERYTFQVALFSGGNIELRYSSLSGSSNGCTVGIQNGDGSDGLKIADNTESLENNLAIRISPYSTFVEVAQLTGTVASGTQAQLGVTFHAMQLSPGNYTANIQITPTSGAVINIPATLQVTNLPSQVAIIEPVDGYSLLEGVGVTFTATATDPDTTIQKVEFYDGTAKLGEGSYEGYDNRYSFTWSDFTSGTHVITAKAVDNFGQATSSNPISFIGIADSDRDGLPDEWEIVHGLNPHDASDANADPDGDGFTNLQEYTNGTDPHVPNILKIIQPVTGQQFEMHSTVPISADVENFDIDTLTFYMQAGDGSGGTWLPLVSSTTAAYQSNIDYIGYGDYAIKAICHTKNGTNVSSNVVTIHVNNPDQDQNGLPDAWEQKYFGHTGVDPTDDPDGDGVSNLEEYRHGTDPTKSDTDGDGVTDGEEIEKGSSPISTISTPNDSNTITINVGINDEDFKDDVWGVRMQISDENGDFSGTPQDVVDNQGNVQGTSTTSVYIPKGRSVKFTLKRIEAGQGRYTDEYVIHLDPVGAGSGGLVANPSNSPTTGELPWTGGDQENGGSTPPDPKGLQWVFNAIEPDYSGGDTVVPVDDATGNKYRKIALNGRPMPDEKPQHTEETTEQKEETFVDAMTLGLRHSTTEIYIPIPGSTLNLSARRDVISEPWNNAGGLRPAERLDRPFGACWTSSLSPMVDYVQINGQPEYLNVTDEGGAQHRFLFTSSGSSGYIFVPMPTSSVETNDAIAKLEWDNGHLKYTGKYGNVINFEDSGVYRSNYNDRKNHSGYEVHTYYRATSVTDRVGTGLTYSYSGQTTIPSRIASTSNPSQYISISTQPTAATYISGTLASAYVISSIADPSGNVWSFSYITREIHDSNTFVEDGGIIPLLEKVVRPDNSVIKYTYDLETEADTRSWLSDGDKVLSLHCDLNSIRSPLLSESDSTPGYSINYEMEHTKYDCDANHGYYIKTGLPRTVSSVNLPNGASSYFSNRSYVAVKRDVYGAIFMAPGAKKGSEVIDAEGNITTYSFTYPVPVEAKLDETLGFAKSSYPTKIFYCGMTITHCLPDGTPMSIPTATGVNNGVESYSFDIQANMALSAVTDLSGNTTTYVHNETIVYPVVNSLQSLFQMNLGIYYDDPSSQTTDAGTKSFTYGVWRIMSQSVDELGRQTVNTLDAKGRRLDETISYGGNILKETSFTYGNSSYPGVVTEKRVKRHGSDPAWAKDMATSYTLDNAGNILTETVDSDVGGLNLATRYTYDNNNNKKSTTDPNANRTSFDYSSLNRLIKTTYADGSFKTYGYDNHGNKTSEVDENGHETDHVYDTMDRLLQTRRLMGNSTNILTQFGYNNVNSKTSTTDPNGNITQIIYDCIQRPTDIITAVGSPVSGTTHLEYGVNSGASTFDISAFKPTRSTDPRGIITEVAYDTLYHPVSRTVYYLGANGATTTTAYDAVGNPVSQVDPVGNLTVTAYNGLNQPVQVSYYGQNQAGGNILASTQTGYTTTELKWQTTDELGRITEMQYDGAQRPVKVIAPAVDDGHGNMISGTTHTLYDAAGNVVGVINPLGNETDYGFNNRNRKAWEKSPQVTDAETSTFVRPLIQWSYDNVGNQLQMIDPKGATTDTSYDNANRPVQVIGPEVADPTNSGGTARPTTNTVYDGNGNITYVQDPNGNWTCNRYDALNRLSSTTSGAAAQNGSGITVSYEYDLVGNRTKVIDGNSHATLFEYDGLNRNTKMTDAAGLATIFGYDTVDKISRTDANGVVTQYTYDYRHRLITVTYPADRPDLNAGNRVYTYDLVGNILGVSEPGKAGKADVAYLYDGLNRQIAETSGTNAISASGCVVNGVAAVNGVYSYDLAGNRLSALYLGDTMAIAYSYDALNRLTGITENGRNSVYGYDKAGNLARKTLPNGDVESMTYDLAKRLTWEASDSSAGQRQYGYTYSHDLAGNLTGILESDLAPYNQAQTFTYDRNNRLTDETSTAFGAKHYTYDDGNNRTSFTDPSTGALVSCTYNALNQIVGTNSSDGKTVTFGYDANGNRTTRSSSGVVNQYSYDGENRLLGVTSGSDGKVYSYTYDYRTRRVERVENGLSTKVIFSGGLSVKEYDNGSTYATVEYIRGHEMGGGIGGILYSNRGGALSFDHYNIRGDVVATTEASGAKTWQGWYDAFGTHTHEKGTAPQDRQRANTKDEDPTGLLNEGFRYRDLETGVFITADPLGFKAGPNFYTYVRQNPWTSFDPEGLEDTPPPPPKPKTLEETRKGGVRLKDVVITKLTDKEAQGILKQYNAPISKPEDVADKRVEELQGSEQYKGKSSDEVRVGESARMNAARARKELFTHEGNAQDKQYLKLYSSMLGITAEAAMIPFLGGRAPAALLEGAANRGMAQASIRTPYALETQGMSPEAQAALIQARGGASLFRTGNLGESMAGESQYWSLQTPALNPRYASQMGLPSVGSDMRFIMGGTLRNGAPAVTNSAAGLGTNAGKGIQVVTQPGGVDHLWFHMPD